MKRLSWLMLGVIGGFIAAHFVNKHPTGHELLAEVDARIGEFTERIGDAYRTQEAQFSSFLDEAKSVAAPATGTTPRVSDPAAAALSD